MPLVAPSLLSRKVEDRVYSSFMYLGVACLPTDPVMEKSFTPTQTPV